MRYQVAAQAVALLLLAAPLPGQTSPPRRVILITFDGVRTQELFGGMDTTIAGSGSDGGVYDLERLRRDYWRPTPEERRRALMPFLWDSLIPRGLVFGDQSQDSRARITNPHGFSAPGYLEILTGQAQPDVASNDPVRYSHETVLQYARRRLGLPSRGVAAFTSWDNFRFYVSSEPDAVFVNAGYDTLPSILATPAMRDVATLQTRALALWEGSRLDAFTGAMAMGYLSRFRPRLLYVAMNDTDDLAHSRRYDRLLDALHALDSWLRDLWHVVQTTPGYRGRTTLILSTDHGRGRTPKDWDDHGEGVPGSEEIWIAVIGPGTPSMGAVAGGPEVHQADIAATILACLGLDVRDWSAEPGPPLPRVCQVAR
jgi:hypothetical protein